MNLLKLSWFLFILGSIIVLISFMFPDIYYDRVESEMGFMDDSSSDIHTDAETISDERNLYHDEIGKYIFKSIHMFYIGYFIILLGIFSAVYNRRKKIKNGDIKPEESKKDEKLREKGLKRSEDEDDWDYIVVE